MFRRSGFITINHRSLGWFAAGVATTLVAVTAFAGDDADAVPAEEPAPADQESAVVPIDPCRLFDTRPEPEFNVGSRSTPIGGDEVHAQQVTGNVGECSVPATATSVSINVVAVRATAPSHLSLFPYDPIPPSTASLNFGPGQGPAFNTVDVKIGPGGKIGVYNLAGSVHVIGDVVSYSTAVGLSSMQDEIDALRDAVDLLETQMDRQDRNHVFSAAVGSDGSKGSTGDFTSSRFTTGGYSVVFDISSFEIPRTVGLSSLEPMAVFATSCIGRNVTGTVVSATGTTTFDDVIIDVRVTDLNGAASNCPVAVQMVISDPTPLSIGTL